MLRYARALRLRAMVERLLRDVDGHNHMSAVGSLGVDEAALGVPLGRFVERHAVTDSD